MNRECGRELYQNLLDDLFKSSELIYEQHYLCEGVQVDTYLVAKNGEYYSLVKNNGIWVFMFRESI